MIAPAANRMAFLPVGNIDPIKNAGRGGPAFLSVDGCYWVQAAPRRPSMMFLLMAINGSSEARLRATSFE